MSTRVYVGGLPADLRQSELVDIFRHYTPDRCDLKTGYGFLEFRRHHDADDAVHDMHGYKVDGRPLTVQFAKGNPFRKDREGGRDRDRDFPPSERDREVRPRPFVPRQTGFRVEVSGIEGRTSWQDLKDFARQAGNVVYADVFLKDGKKTGVIEFQSQNDMENAVRKLDDTKLDGIPVRVYEARAGSNTAPPHDRSPARSPSPARAGHSRSRSPPRGRHSRSVSRSPPPRGRHSRSVSRSRSPRSRRSPRRD